MTDAQGISPRIQRLIESRRMESYEFTPEQIAGLWNKAVASAADARHTANSLDNRYGLAYQALLQAATAVLAAAGYRTRGAGGGHHHDLFYAVSGLGIHGLDRIDVQTESVRKMRALSIYDPDSATEQELGAAYALHDVLLPAVHRWLATRVPPASVSRFKPYFR